MPEPRVLHVNDAAFTTTTLLREARRRGLPWRFLPIADTDASWHGVSGRVRRAARGARWEAGLAQRAAVSDLLHVHVASVVRHTGWVPRPYVLHLHGTDIRTHQYLPRYRSHIRRAVERAAAVLYSTPDLAEHIDWRPDAALLPVPIDPSALPPWRPAARPTVAFASRWAEVKGLGVQLAIAERVGRARPDVRMLGVDWGSGAQAARERGVDLLPRTTHEGFLHLLASAHVVVGQPTGMLAASELEAVGIGVPVVAALTPRWYPPTRVATPAVLGGLLVGRDHHLPPQDPTQPGARPLTLTETEGLADVLAGEVLGALADPAASSAGLGGSAWLIGEHGVSRAVDRLVELYDGLR